MKEQYKPSEEELKKAEGNMSKFQKEMSESRENHLIFMEKMGKKGYLNKDIEKIDDDKHYGILSGEINGHKINIPYVNNSQYPSKEQGKDDVVIEGFGSREERKEATVDGIPISDEQAQQLIDKYYDSAYCLMTHQFRKNNHDDLGYVNEIIDDLLE